tara:strand:+ start:139 stop:723 length:585 start_codon:yes stop_codon:yes gene_type:complete
MRNTTLTPGENEIFAFPTEAKRDEFIADLARKFSSVHYATNIDPDTTEADRWLVAVQIKSLPTSAYVSELHDIHNLSFHVGDGVSWGAGTDTEVGTVVKVTPKTITVVKDNAELLNATDSGEKDALKFSPGGFCGHFSGTQRYRFTRDTTGTPLKFSWRKGMNRFKLAGTSSRGSMRSWGLLSHGRAKHYDYNF